MGTNDVTYYLPQPEINGDEFTWYPIPRMSGFIPWGYEEDPDDPDIFQPIPEQLYWFNEAKKHIKHGMSLRKASAFIEKKCGVKFSHMGIKMRMEQESRNDARAENLRKILSNTVRLGRKLVELERKRVGVGGIPEHKLDEEERRVLQIIIESVERQELKEEERRKAREAAREG